MACMSRPLREWSFVMALAFGAIAVAPACSGDSTITIISGDSGTSCGDGSQVCGGSCTPVTRDPENCGACGNRCGVGQVCFQGACGTSCGTGTTQCGPSCVDTKVDGQNCGACGTKCSAGEVCSGGKCGLPCQAGLTMCTAGLDGGVSDASSDGGSVLGNPYCANLQSDDRNCGACGAACRVGASCVTGACRYCTATLLLPGVPELAAGGWSPSSVAQGDFNGDGKIDLVAAAGGVSVMLGNGNGTFGAPATLRGRIWNRRHGSCGASMRPRFTRREDTGHPGWLPSAGGSADRRGTRRRPAGSIRRTPRSSRGDLQARQSLLLSFRVAPS